jgi:hydroxymethylpyrimidine/phosphomethylpyrimidine kinase
MTPPPIRTVPIALTIAGSDSSGGAGVQADLKTFSALGVYGASVLTALTAQNTRAVTAILAVPAEFVRAQLAAVLEDLAVSAIKIGMLHSAAVIEAVAEALGRYPQIPVVLDPVMISKSGAALLEPAAVRTLVERLLPRAAVVTPNLPEAAALLGLSDDRAVLADPHAACAALRALGARAVVLKGGHAGGERSDDLLYTADEPRPLILPAARLPVRSTHGTGCTFAAALAAGLSHGLLLRDAAVAAKRYITGAIAAADSLSVGQGHPGSSGPVHHFFALWPTLRLPLD